MTGRRADGRPWALATLALAAAVLIGLLWSQLWARQDDVRRLEGRAVAAERRLAVKARQLDRIRKTPTAYLLLYRRATIARLADIDPRWNEIMRKAWKYSKKWGVPAELTVAKIEHESAFNPEAVGLHGEMGLMQVNPVPWPQFDTGRGFDIDYNLDFGCMIFASCMKRAKGNVRLALQMYNGMGELPAGAVPYPDRVLGGLVMRRYR